jgi:hypothetical protein
MEQQELESIFHFVTEFMYAALNDGQSASEIIASYDYKFPTFRWNVDEYMGWLNTKYSKDRGTKDRVFYEIA